MRTYDRYEAKEQSKKQKKSKSDDIYAKRNYAKRWDPTILPKVITDKARLWSVLDEDEEDLYY